MAEHDGDDLLAEAARLRDGEATRTWEPDPAPIDPVAAADPVAPPPGRRRVLLRDPAALLVGLWFVLAGLFAALVGDATLDDAPPVLIPLTFAVVGLGLLVPKRPAR